MPSTIKKKRHYTRPNSSINDRIWKADVESFARWASLYHMTNNANSKEFAIKRMGELQAKHKHKLGDIPNA